MAITLNRTIVPAHVNEAAAPIIRAALRPGHSHVQPARPNPCDSKRTQRDPKPSSALGADQGLAQQLLADLDPLGQWMRAQLAFSELHRGIFAAGLEFGGPSASAGSASSEGAPMEAACGTWKVTFSNSNS